MDTAIEKSVDKVVDHCKDEKKKPYKIEVVWINVVVIGLLHLFAVYGAYVRFFCVKYWSTIIIGKVLGIGSSLSVTIGAHRLWCHRSYKANRLLEIFLMLMMTCTYQNSIYTWCRDHRLHHKFSETDADPHNAKRGFFFSHVGWLFVRKHPDVKEKGKLIDMSDLKANKIVMFQHKYYYPMVFMMSFFLPVFGNSYFFGESLWVSFFVVLCYRYVTTVNVTWGINSFAHLYGNKPYDKNIGPTENPLMMILGLGEGFHNYHHTFPYDYRTSEVSMDLRNSSTMIIDAFAYLGWATELKTVPREFIKKRISRSGDTSYSVNSSQAKNIINAILVISYLSLI